MGGFGSGFRGVSKDTTASRFALHIRRWGNAFPGEEVSVALTVGGIQPLGRLHVRKTRDALLLTFTPHEDPPWQQEVEVEWQRCRFGGSRPWFRCPHCARRCGALYRARYGYACRTCCGLTYQSTRELPGHRAVGRADQIRERLGWPPGIIHGHGSKPPRMHWRTFIRLVDEHDRLADQFSISILDRLEAMRRQS